jgi:DNA polymerase-1
MKKLLLVDANSIIHRSFHALPPFTTPAGKPSGAIYGIASILLKLWRDDRPDYIAALFDRPEPTFRDKIYAEYKAQRPPAPSELVQQIIEAHHLFAAFGVTTFEKPGYEADDLIATLAVHFKNTPDLQVVILTGDRDTLQLVDSNKLVVQIFNTGISDTTIYDESAVIAKYDGLAPTQLIEYKALVGDNSDNIKGVPGIGPKTGTELIKRFGTVENMFEHLAEDEKLQQKFGAYRKEAELSRELVILEKHAPIEMPELEALRPFPSTNAAEEYFIEMGFSTLVKRLHGEDPKAAKAKASAKSAAAKKHPPAAQQQQSLF